MAAGLRHISLKTGDLKKTERFYTEVLGLKVAFRFPKNVFLCSSNGNDMVHFISSGKKIGAAQSLDHFGFKVSRPELEKLEKKLQESAVEIEGRRGRDSIYFRDPNGYLVEFYCD
jgi:catechol 2,3-dioxygenase-like lactoylglutathione lyase family enzyme